MNNRRKYSPNLVCSIQIRRQGCEDKEGRGRPSELDDNALLEAVEQDESYTTRMLGEEFGVDQSTIVRHLLQLGKVWKLCGWVPHELTNKNKQDRVFE